jgi:hypothetical protein
LARERCWEKSPNRRSRNSEFARSKTRSE